VKILVLCYEYPPIGGGGGRVAQNVAEKLVARSHAVRVQTAALGWSSIYENVNGVEVCRTASGRKVPDTCSVVEMGMYLVTSFVPVLRHIATWKPDVIHVHFAMPTGILAWMARLLTGTPYVLTAHLGDVPGGVPEQTDRLFQVIGPIAGQVWQRASEATAVSSFVQGLAEQAYRRPVTRILNGVELNGFQAPAPVAGSERHFVFLGRFNPQKNPDFLIDVFARLKDLPWKLTMIGDGPVMPKVLERIAQHGLPDRIVCTGWLKGPEVDAILGKTDVLCMPSQSEGMPVAAIEALRRGLAIAASDIPGLLDVVENGKNGFLVPVNDAEAFADKLRLLCMDGRLLAAMREASWEKAREFELGAIVDQYDAVLRAAAEG